MSSMDTQSKGFEETVGLKLIEDSWDFGRIIITAIFIQLCSLMKQSSERISHPVEIMRKHQTGSPSEIAKSKIKSGDIVGKENKNGL